MSPKTKKILMIAAAAVGGYIVYTKVIKKPAPAAPIATTKAQLLSAGTLKSAAITMATQQIGRLAGDPVIEALGIEESLGSLGSKRR